MKKQLKLFGTNMMDKPVSGCGNPNAREYMLIAKDKYTKSGTVELAPCTCNFIVME